MYYRRHGYSAVPVDTNVTYEDLAKQHKGLSKLINNLIYHSGLNAEWVAHTRSLAKEECRDRTSKLRTAIEKKCSLLQPVQPSYSLKQTGDEINVTYNPIIKPIMDSIFCAMVRQECILEVQKNFLNIDNVQAEADQGAIAASRAWASVQTDIGYYNQVTFSGVKGADPMNVTYTEELEDNKYYDYNTRKYITKGKKVKKSESMIGINENWIEDVQKKGLQYTDIGGKNCLVTSAKEVEEHELKDQNVKLYDCTVCYTLRPLSANSWQSQAGEPAKWFHVEKRHVAVQKLPSGSTEQASGKDKSWAIRTMKARMKRTMMKQMGL